MVAAVTAVVPGPVVGKTVVTAVAVVRAVSMRLVAAVAVAVVLLKAIATAVAAAMAVVTATAVTAALKAEVDLIWRCLLALEPGIQELPGSFLQHSKIGTLALCIDAKVVSPVPCSRYTLHELHQVSAEIPDASASI